MPRYRKPAKIVWSKGNNKVSQGISWTASFFQYFPNFARKNLRFKSLFGSTGKEDESGKGWAKSRNKHGRSTMQENSAAARFCVKMQLSFISFCSLSFLFVSFHRYSLSFRQPCLWNKACYFTVCFIQFPAKSVPEWMRFLMVLLQYKC